jgi:hypothetical protein
LAPAAARPSLFLGVFFGGGALVAVAAFVAAGVAFARPVVSLIARVATSSFLTV